MLGDNWFAFVVGVGNNPYSVALVWVSKAGSGNTKPFCIIPDLGQFPEKLSEPTPFIFLRAG